MLLPLGPEGSGVLNCDIPYYSLLLHVAFALKHKFTRKNLRNVDVRIHMKLELLERGC